MEEGGKAEARQILQDSWFRYENHLRGKVDEDGSSHENSMDLSDGSSVSLSSSSFDTTDDVSSSNSSESVYDLSDLMVQLPIKRGLSKFYQGKSESFTSLSRVTSVEDLAKKPSPYRRKMKPPSKSCRNGSNTAYKPYILPKPIISKAKKLDTNNKRGSFVSIRPKPRPSLPAASSTNENGALIADFSPNNDSISRNSS